MGAPQRLRRSVEQYKIVKRAQARRHAGRHGEGEARCAHHLLWRGLLCAGALAYQLPAHLWLGLCLRVEGMLHAEPMHSVVWTCRAADLRCAGPLYDGARDEVAALAADAVADVAHVGLIGGANISGAALRRSRFPGCRSSAQPTPSWRRLGSSRAPRKSPRWRNRAVLRMRLSRRCSRSSRPTCSRPRSPPRSRGCCEWGRSHLSAPAGLPDETALYRRE